MDDKDLETLTELEAAFSEKVAEAANKVSDLMNENGIQPSLATAFALLALGLGSAKDSVGRAKKPEWMEICSILWDDVDQVTKIESSN